MSNKKESFLSPCGKEDVKESHLVRHPGENRGPVGSVHDALKITLDSGFRRNDAEVNRIDLFTLPRRRVRWDKDGL
jgi:hypothetical protein